MTDIKQQMVEIIGLENPPIYSISLVKTDHSSWWRATAMLRANDHHFTIEADTPEHALQYLKDKLVAAVCPYCERYMEDKHDGATR